MFSESANSNNPYFATGAGAMLQAVIYGFGGVEQTDMGLKYNTGLLPKQWKSAVHIGLKSKFLLCHLFLFSTSSLIIFQF